MKLDQKINPSEIVSNVDLAEKFARAAKADLKDTTGQHESNKNLRMQVAFQGGALIEANLHTWPDALMARMAKIQAGLMGAYGAATDPTVDRTQKLEQRLEVATAIPVTMPQKPGVNVGVRYTVPKNGL